MKTEDQQPTKADSMCAKTFLSLVLPSSRRQVNDATDHI